MCPALVWGSPDVATAPPGSHRYSHSDPAVEFLLKEHPKQTHTQSQLPKMGWVFFLFVCFSFELILMTQLLCLKAVYLNDRYVDVTG